MHGPQSARYGWEWYEMGFVACWNPSGVVTLVCFDVPEKTQSSVQSMFRVDAVNGSSPYPVFSLVSDALLRLYDDSVWSIRNHISQWEVVSRLFYAEFRTRKKREEKKLTCSREDPTRPTTSFCTRLQDMGCMSAKRYAWLYGLCTLYGNSTRAFALAPVLTTATLNTHARISLGIDWSSSTGFCRACSIDPKRTMRGSRMRLLLYVCHRLTQEAVGLTSLGIQRSSTGGQQDPGANRRRSEARSVSHEGDCRGDDGFFASHLRLRKSLQQRCTLEQQANQQTLFGMSFFSFQPEELTPKPSFVVSRHFWVYWALSVPLTIATVAVWFWWSRWSRHLSFSASRAKIFRRM